MIHLVMHAPTHNRGLRKPLFLFVFVLAFAVTCALNSFPNFSILGSMHDVEGSGADRRETRAWCLPEHSTKMQQLPSALIHNGKSGNSNGDQAHAISCWSSEPWWT
jgi:hypothetical protein